MNRREFVRGAVAGAAALALTEHRGLIATTHAALQRDAVVAQVAKQHDATVKMLKDWIAFPSIAAENRGYPQGAEYVAKLAQDAGFQRVEIVPTRGKPGVFGTLDAGAATTLAIYFMYDV